MERKRKAFHCSFCYQGLRGGGMYTECEAVVYRTGTLTLPEKYRKLKMPYEKIREVRCLRVAVFPAVEIRMENGEAYRFIVFLRKRFLEELRFHGVSRIGKKSGSGHGQSIGLLACPVFFQAAIEYGGIA